MKARLRNNVKFTSVRGMHWWYHEKVQGYLAHKKLHLP